MNITDKDQPHIQSCPTNLTRETDFGESTAMVVWEEGIATHDSGEDINVVCDTSSGSIFNLGETKVLCEAVDKNGNTAVCSFNVYIIGKSTNIN